MSGPQVAGHRRPVWAQVDLDAIRHNARLLCQVVAPSQLCAVVKAGGYGHGAVEVAGAALDGGATWLAVALVDEGLDLRQRGIDAPVLVLSEPPWPAMAEVVAAGLTPTIYTAGGLDALAVAAAHRPGPEPVAVHLKVDTGMHRVGALPEETLQLARAVASRPELHLEGVFTHFAVADELDNAATAAQFARFEAVLDALAAEGLRPRLRHAANSAGALWHPATRLDLVRCGLALYGLAPAATTVGLPPAERLRPALSLRAEVSYVKEVDAGERVSYGLRYRLATRSTIATVPVGYADGLTRRLSATGGHVLVGGRRCPLAGTVTMDQITVDCGPAAPVAVGDEVVMLGRQGDQEITAWEWALRVGTIAYEVVCGISERVPRRYSDSGEPCCGGR